MPFNSAGSCAGGRGGASAMSGRLVGVQPGHDAPHDGERMGVVIGVMVGDAGLAGVNLRAAQLLRRNDLAGCGLHQRRAAEEDRALPFDDHAFVGHRGNIGAARGAGAHHRGDLGNARRRHRRLIVEDAAEMLAVGEDVGLVRQIAAARVHQIDAGQPVLARDLLGAQMLLHRHRIIGAALDRRVVADDDAFAAFDAPDARDHPRAVDVAVVHAVGGKRRQLQERRAGIEQAFHPITRQQLAAFGVALPASLITTQRSGRHARFQFLHQRAHRCGVGFEGSGTWRDGGFESRHPNALYLASLRDAPLPRGEGNLSAV